MSKILKIFIPLVIVLATTSFFLWRFLPSEPKLSTNQERDARYIGVSVDAGGNQLSSDRSNLFWTTNSAKGGVAATTAPVYFPSILRIGKGFATPDENSILWLSNDLQERTRHSVPGLAKGKQRFSANSPNHQHGLFTFNTGTADNSAQTKAVAVNKRGIRTIDRKHSLSALTPCDNGDMRWLEFYPTNKNEPAGPGTAKLVTWTADGHINEAKVAWDFPHEPAHENTLSCDSSKSIIMSEDGAGKPISLLLEEKNSGFNVTVRKQASLAPTTPSAKARFSTVQENVFYSLDKENKLTAVDLKTGKLIYSQALNTKGDSPLSISFEDDNAYLVVRPENFGHQQAVLPINLKKPSCFGEITPLVGYDELSFKSRLRKLGDSSMMVTSILPTGDDASIDCVGQSGR